jgi:hypothetical protein
MMGEGDFIISHENFMILGGYRNIGIVIYFTILKDQ